MKFNTKSFANRIQLTDENEETQDDRGPCVEVGGLDVGNLGAEGVEPGHDGDQPDEGDHGDPDPDPELTSVDPEAAEGHQGQDDDGDEELDEVVAHRTLEDDLRGDP